MNLATTPTPMIKGTHYLRLDDEGRYEKCPGCDICNPEAGTVAPQVYTHTVAQLIEYLQQLPQDHVVVFSEDAEGNGYSPWCGDHSTGWYTPTCTWAGEFVSEGNFEEEPDEYDIEDAIPAIALWPVN